jgi:hypothetical protein
MKTNRHNQILLLQKMSKMLKKSISRTLLSKNTADLRHNESDKKLIVFCV